MFQSVLNFFTTHQTSIQLFFAWSLMTLWVVDVARFKELRAAFSQRFSWFSKLYAYSSAATIYAVVTLVIVQRVPMWWLAAIFTELYIIAANAYIMKRYYGKMRLCFAFGTIIEVALDDSTAHIDEESPTEMDRTLGAAYFPDDPPQIAGAGNTRFTLRP